MRAKEQQMKDRNKLVSIPTSEYRALLFQQVDAILHKPEFSREDSSRADGLIRLAQLINSKDESRIMDADEEKRHQIVNEVLRLSSKHITPMEAGPGGQPERSLSIYGKRDLNTLSSQLSLPTSVLVAQQIFDELSIILKTFDPLQDPQVVSVWTSETGAAASLPGFDASQSAAQQIAEGAVDTSDTTTTIKGIGLGSAPTFRTPLLRISRELVQDTKFDFGETLAKVFGMQMALGIGPTLVSSLTSAAPVGATAIGSAKTTGGNEDGSNSIGWGDLVSLRTSIQPIYRKSPKCAWLMNDNTLSYLDSLIDKSGLPIIRPHYDQDGNRLLMGFKVHISPSFQNIGVSNYPVAFGDLSYFLTRIVKESLVIRILFERFAEYYQLAYFAKLRANGALLGVTSYGSPVTTDSPVKLLQCAAS
jgi:HK97 family phage major capsid protein